MLVKIRVVQANSQSLRWMKMNFLQEAVSSVQNVVEQFNCVASTLQWNTATGTPHPLVCSCFRAAQSCIIIISQILMINLQCPSGQTKPVPACWSSSAWKLCGWRRHASDSVLVSANLSINPSPGNYSVERSSTRHGTHVSGPTRLKILTDDLLYPCHRVTQCKT